MGGAIVTDRKCTETFIVIKRKKKRGGRSTSSGGGGEHLAREKKTSCFGKKRGGLARNRMGGKNEPIKHSVSCRDRGEREKTASSSQRKRDAEGEEKAGGLPRKAGEGGGEVWKKGRRPAGEKAHKNLNHTGGE